MDDRLEPARPADQPLGDDPVAELEVELDLERQGRPPRLARYLGRVRAVVVVLAALVAGTAVLALVVGALAVRGSVIGLLVVVLLCAPALLAPAYVVWRTGPLASAASQPRELASQTLDLVTRFPTSPEVAALGRQLVGRDDRDRGRVRGAVVLVRRASAVVGLAAPDPERHPLVVAIHPARLRGIWLATLIALWAWLVVVAVIVGALAVLAIGAL